MAMEPNVADLVRDIQDALKGSDLFGELVGRYSPYFPDLTDKLLGFDHDFSFVTLCAVLDRLIEHELGKTVGRI